MKFKFSNKNIAAIYILMAVCFLSYAPGLGNEFLIDDHHLIVNNDTIKDLADLPAVLGSSYLEYYRPLSSLSLAIDYHFWRLNPFGFHLTNILLHFFNCLLLFFLLQMIFSNFELALLCAMIFCVHPLVSVPVNYISDRSNLLAGAFMFLALIGFVLGYKRGQRQWLMLSLGMFAAALFSRENAIFFPLYLLCVIFALEGNKDMKILGLYFAGVLAIVLGYFSLRPDLVFYARSEVNIASLKSINAFLYLGLKYIQLALSPFNIYFFRRIPDLNIGRILAMYAVFAGIFGLIYAQRKNRIFMFFAFWFVCGLLPLYKMMFARAEIGLIMQESWIYFSLPGLFGIFALGLGAVKARGRAVFYQILLAGLMLFLVSESMANTRLWQNTATYCRYWLKSLPKNPLALSNLALYYLQNKDYGQALYYYQKFKQDIDPAQVEAADKRIILNKIGVCYYELGDLENAEKYFQASLDIDYPILRDDPYFGLGIVYLKKADQAKAQEYFLKAVDEVMNNISFQEKSSRLFPDAGKPVLGVTRVKFAANLARSRHNLIFMGAFFFREKIFEDAAKCLEASVLVDPSGDNSGTHYNLGVIYGRLNKPDKAIENFILAAKNKKYYLAAKYSLSLLYRNIGNLERSRETVNEVLLVDPGYYERMRRKE